MSGTVLRRSLGIMLALVSTWLSCSRAGRDFATFDPDGTAHLARVVPMPSSISPEAQKWLASLAARGPGPKTLAENRAATDAWRAQDAGEARRLYPVRVEQTSVAGVRTDIITPLDPSYDPNRVLINVHGGGFIVDSGSLIEGVPIANLAKIKVLSLYYRLAPENPFPAAVDDVVAVYRQSLTSYKPASIGIFGTSAGATLTSEVAVRLKQLGLPLPAALGMFSVHPDLSRPMDSQQLFTLDGFPGELEPQDPNRPPENSYAGNTDRKDPVLSPMFADLHGWPPCLLITSTRDLLLSDTATFHLALLESGDDAQLVVFEALPHAFWYHFQLPETKRALDLMARFFDQKVGRRPTADKSSTGPRRRSPEVRDR
jgi:epsilon-lactone hydrolase